MIKIMFVAVFILSLSFQHQAFSQAASTLWTLTSAAGATPTVSGNITATPIQSGPGLSATTFIANGATASNFDGAVCTPNADDYFAFSVTSNCSNDLSVTSVSFEYRTNTTTPARCIQFKYSVNGGPETLITEFTFTNTTPTAYTNAALSIQVPQGQVILFRIYGATGATNRSISVRNFTVNGNTTAVTPPAPLLSISANPSGPICPGQSVTYTATPANGGTSPSYQWQLNGVNTGTNSPVYTNSVWSAGDQVSCILTSNFTCVSPATVTSNTIIITISSSTIGTPGPITGSISVPPSTPGLIYSIAAVPNATIYNWTFPFGWAVTSGAGTTSVTVTSGSVGQNGNVSVTAATPCATSNASTLAVGILPPHNSCEQCHITHTSAGGQLTNVLGNGNLCMSCHTSNGSASSKPFSNAMKAIPGVSGNSHNWDKPAINSIYETNTPTITQMQNRLPGGNIICSTCHDQHDPLTYPVYMRAPNTGDAMCKNCHTARNVGTYASNPSSNKGSHPVGVMFNPSDPRFLATPTSPFAYVDSKVECNSCHMTHYAASTDGNLLRAANNNAVCTSCHIEKSTTVTLDHKGMGCKACHKTHNTDKSNILMVTSNLVTPNSGTKPVVFTANTGAGNYADGAGPYDGICEVCHTSTDHYTNVSGGNSDARHMPATQKCVNCHPHNNGFSAITNCLDCHNVATDKPGVGPAGGRRQIVDNLGNGLGTGGDFKRTSHHVTGSVPNVSDCIKCHYMGDHMRGTVKLLDPDLGFLNVLAYDPLNKAGVESFCLKCHDADGANGDLTPFSDNVTVPVIDATMWNASSHKGSSNTCLSCHDNGHGSNKRVMLGPYNYTANATADPMNEEEGFCLNCHGAAGIASVKVHLAFSGNTNTSTAFYKHDPAATYQK
ncbi:MAG: hypothetical protein NTU44_20540, partial [Bacteroidetes bacterium]|nr:hypothetical protein [Bacteroidota bacterium]